MDKLITIQIIFHDRFGFSPSFFLLQLTEISNNNKE